MNAPKEPGSFPAPVISRHRVQREVPAEAQLTCEITSRFQGVGDRTPRHGHENGFSLARCAHGADGGFSGFGPPPLFGVVLIADSEGDLVAGSGEPAAEDASDVAPSDNGDLRGISWLSGVRPADKEGSKADSCGSQKPRRPTGSMPKGLVSDALRNEGERVQAANSVSYRWKEQ